MQDIRDIIFKDIINKKFKAELISEKEGIFAGADEAKKQAEEIGIELELYCTDGQNIKSGEKIGTVTAEPKKMAIAEEKIIGSLAKYSGIATAARKAVISAGGKVKIVAGSWKKMPPQIKDGVRKAVDCAGASFRITDIPMIYLDKNYIRMLGSIPKALEAANEYKNFAKVVQLKGKDNSIEEETVQAIENGCNILMVDTGDLEDLQRCVDTVNGIGARDQVQIAFAGNVKLNQVEDMSKRDIDILCIGKEIVDAQLLDIKLDVLK
jgi:nicotinate-nucleotide pyrophosphorylase (carboxylating)